MRLRHIFTVALVAGCDTPDMVMQGVPARHVSVENSRFSVYVSGTKAEAIRTNFEVGRAAQGIMARGFRAIELASGCEIVPGTFDGDPARMTASLYCPVS